MNLDHIQEALRREKLDGWLFFDHHQRDPLAYRVLGVQVHRHVTRRWYYLIPANGEPRGIVHRVEAGIIDNLPGEKTRYSSWQEQHAALKTALKGMKRVAMQYSPLCAVPYVAMIDAGTIELIRGFGIDVVTSAELIQEFEACLTAEQFETHLEAGRRVDRVREGAFRFIGEKLDSGVDELTVHNWIREEFRQAGLVHESGPIVAVNAHAGDPHYEPRAETSSPIRKGDFVLLDMWAKLDQAGSAYYDITWTGVCGEPSPQIREVFEAVKGGRDRAIQTVQRAVASGITIRGFEVDDAAREYIGSKGYGDRFVHRTGHSIGEEVHGTGANMDNLETHDDRKILPGALFSVEPGIYFDSFGIRLEVNVFIAPREASATSEARVTGEIQRELVRIQ